MEEEKQDVLLKELRAACPHGKFLLLSTMQRGETMILQVKGNMGCIDSWEYNEGYRLWWDVIYPTTERLGICGSIRTLFILSETEFVLYAPALGIRGGVFGDMEQPVNYEVYGDTYHQYYLGRCQKVDDVINYLQKKKRTF